MFQAISHSLKKKKKKVRV